MIQPAVSPVLTWRLHAVMANQGIKTAKELKSIIQAEGLTLSISTVSRLVYKKPVQLDMSILEILCRSLKCTPNDLLI